MRRGKPRLAPGGSKLPHSQMVRRRDDNCCFFLVGDAGTLQEEDLLADGDDTEWFQDGINGVGLRRRRSWRWGRYATRRRVAQTTDGDSAKQNAESGIVHGITNGVSILLPTAWQEFDPGGVGPPDALAPYAPPFHLGGVLSLENRQLLGILQFTTSDESASRTRPQLAGHADAYAGGFGNERAGFTLLFVFSA